MAIADTITSMQNHTSNAYTMIGYGTDLTGINKNLENLSTSMFNAFLEALRTPDTLFTNLPKKSGSGANITLNDTANAPMRIELGASELTQDGTPTPSSPQDIHTISGDNTIKIVGKNLFNNNFNDYTRPTDYRIFPINLEIGETYSLKSTLIGTKMTGVAVGIVPFGEKYSDFSSNLNLTIDSSGNTITRNITPTSEWTSPKLVIYASDEATFNSIFENYEVQLELGSATSYEPYQEQTAQVNLGDLEYSKIGNYENEFIRTSGKNLFDKSTALTNRLVNSSTGNVGTDTGTTASDFIYIKGLDSIILSGTTVSYGNGGAFYDDNKTYVSGFSSSALKNGLSIPNNVSYIRFNTLNTAVDTTMLNKGLTALPYEPYGSNEWYIKKNIGKVVLDGSESWSDFSVGDSNFRCQYDVALPNILTPPTNPAQLFSNYFKAINRDNAYAKTEIGIAQYGSTLGKIFICAPISILSEQTLNGWKTWLSTHNTEVYYPFATPTYTQITGTLETQLENVYQKLLSYKGQTTISQINADLPFNMSIQAIEDISNE